MRKQALEPLDVLAGEWELTLTNSWFPESLDALSAHTGHEPLVKHWDASEDVA